MELYFTKIVRGTGSKCIENKQNNDPASLCAGAGKCSMQRASIASGALGFTVQAQKICPKKEISRTLSESRLTALSLIPSNMLVSLKLALGFSAQRPERVPFPSQSNFD
jgi:hypothetical protein